MEDTLSHSHTCCIWVDPRKRTLPKCDSGKLLLGFTSKVHIIANRKSTKCRSYGLRCEHFIYYFYFFIIVIYGLSKGAGTYRGTLLNNEVKNDRKQGEKRRYMYMDGSRKEELIAIATCTCVQ